MTLLDALHEGRFFDVELTLPVGAPRLLRQLAEWARTAPERVRELYEAAGMPPPLQVAGPVIQESPRLLRMDDIALMGESKHLHPRGGKARVMALLRDGVPRSDREIAQRLSMTVGHVRTAVHRLRKSKVRITHEKNLRGGASYRYLGPPEVAA